MLPDPDGRGFPAHRGRSGLVNPAATTARARRMMLDFAAATGLDPPTPTPRRYLWTDAFAVCVFLELFQRTRDETCRTLAVRLVDQVHRTLGRHRPDDARQGWISGLSESEGARHPTRGGLRIGKPLPERQPAEPYDERREWEQDGQYYHYLTKWMHALCRMSRATGDPAYALWAGELAQAAQRAFMYAPRPGHPPRMCWKMSIDLTRPLVVAMGQHDPLDGFVTCREIQATVKATRGAPGFDLRTELAALAGLCEDGNWVTDDPLGIGGLLFDAVRLAQLPPDRAFPHAALLEQVVEAARVGLASFTRGGSLRHPARYRLPFRELGLAVGLRGVGKLREILESNPTALGEPRVGQQRLIALEEFVPLAATIEQFWLDDANQAADTWSEHREINRVTLATCLAPGEFLSAAR